MYICLTIESEHDAKNYVYSKQIPQAAKCLVDAPRQAAAPNSQDISTIQSSGSGSFELTGAADQVNISLPVHCTNILLRLFVS